MAAGCRDSINPLDEPYVDGMPVEKSLECLRGIWGAALEHHRDVQTSLMSWLTFFLCHVSSGAEKVY